VTDLTVVSFAGPDLGLLCAAGKVRKAVYGFVSLDSIPLEPFFRRARQRGEIQVREWDEGMMAELGNCMRDASICGLGQAAANPVFSVLKHFREDVT